MTNTKREIKVTGEVIDIANLPERDLKKLRELEDLVREVGPNGDFYAIQNAAMQIFFSEGQKYSWKEIERLQKTHLYKLVFDLARNYFIQKYINE